MRGWSRRFPTRWIPSKIQNFAALQRALAMWDTCAVELRVNLPKSVAAEVQEVQRRDPDMLSRMVYYAMTSRTIFDHLSSHSRAYYSPEPLTPRVP
jgi:hypothetical protein